MLGKNEIIEKAYECGFGDIGFTTGGLLKPKKNCCRSVIRNMNGPLVAVWI